MTLDEQIVRKRLLERSSREEVVLNAMQKYNEFLRDAQERIMRFASERREDPKEIFHRTIQRLPELAEEDELRSRTEPSYAQRAKERRTLYKLLAPLRKKIEHGMSLEKALAEILVPDKVPDYRKYMLALQERGVVVSPQPGQTTTTALRDLAPYQILLLEREHNIPAPLSQTLIKEPGISRQEAVQQIVEYYMRQEEEKMIFTVRRGLGRKVVHDRAAAKIVNHMRRYRQQNEIRLREHALAIVSDLPTYERLLLSRNAAVKLAVHGEGPNKNYGLTNGLIEEKHLTPEQLFAAAFAVSNPTERCLTGMYRGVERSRQHVVVFDNIEAAMKMVAYARIIQGNGQTMPVQLSLWGLSKLYANTIEGFVASRSGIKDHYNPSVVSLPVFESEENIAWRTPFDTEPHCECKDAKYMADMHAKAQYPFIYTDTHAVALAFAGMLLAHSREGFVINPFPLPTPGQLEFSTRVDSQVLIRSRMDGNVYTPNKAEREVLKIANAREIGYENSYSHDVCVGLATINTLLQ
ncbi:MAG: hypothetical protein AABX98_03205 [Nanoarchaeota archaeon]